MKISGRNINSFKYADDTTLMAESEEELKSLLIRVKEEKEKKKLSQNATFKKLRSWHLVPSLHANRRGKMETVIDFLFLGSKITADRDCSHEIKSHLLLGRKVWQT